MKIRKEHMQVFQQSAARAFRDEMLAHLKGFAPAHCAALGDESVCKVIDLGMARAEKHGFSNRGPARFYLEMMFLFGSGFDTDPQVFWAADVLSGVGRLGQMACAKALYEKTMDYLEKVAGPNNRYAHEAMRAAQQSWGQDGRMLPSDGLGNAILQEMKRIYPQKCDYVGDQPLQSLITAGIAQAQSLSLTSDWAVGLFPGLMFALGHDFIGDPLYPWVEVTLSETDSPDPHVRAGRLRTRALAYLSAAMETIDRR